MELPTPTDGVPIYYNSELVFLIFLFYSHLHRTKPRSSLPFFYTDVQFINLIRIIIL